ncbi:hypothetical protein [Streptomyces sp. YIM B13518]|uniref:hypothetical protein n=1 Tax=Streptomyces sp. YIM B13518 TaxID=3366316 RepID=UPI003686FDF2
MRAPPGTSFTSRLAGPLGERVAGPGARPGDVHRLGGAVDEGEGEHEAAGRPEAGPHPVVRRRGAAGDRGA